MNCKKCGSEMNGQTTCPNCNAEYPMKWYKWLINFVLFVGAALNLMMAILTFTGQIYGSDKGLVYMVFPNLKIIDIVLGVALLILAILGIASRFLLAKFKKSGMYLVCMVYALDGIFNLAHSIALLCVIGMGFDITTIISPIVSFIMVYANGIYFRKRKELFQN